MLNSNKFKVAMKVLKRATKSNDIGIEDILAYYEIMKEDFTDEEFQDSCLAIAKQCTFFPTVAEFYKHKPRPRVPDSGALCRAWYSRMGEKDINEELGHWLDEILNYYEGTGCYNFRELTEKQWDYMCRDFGKAYNAFCKDYQAGSNVRISYDNIPHITQSPSKKKGAISIGESLKGLEI